MSLDAVMIDQVAGEVRESLQLAGAALQDYFSSPEDLTLLRIAATHLHQAQGTLQMADFSTSAILLAETETLIQTQLGDQPMPPESFKPTLMQAISAVESCLGQGQTADCNDQVLGELVNDLRRMQGKTVFPQIHFFRPDIGAYRLKQGNSSADQPDLHALHNDYRRNLQQWFQQPADPAPLEQMIADLDQLEQTAPSSAPGLLWASAAAVCESLLTQGATVSEGTRKALAEVESRLGQFAENGMAQLLTEDLEPLIRSLLWELVSTGTTGERGAELLQQLGLRPAASRSADIARDVQLERLQAIQPDLESRVATARLFLDDYFDPARDDAETLRPLSELLGELRQVASDGENDGSGLKQLLEALFQVCDGFVEGRISSAETVALRLAEGLLVLETSAQDAVVDFSAWRARVQQATENLQYLMENEEAAGEAEVPAPAQTDSDYRTLLAVVAEEVRKNLAVVEQSVTRFSEDTTQLDKLAPGQSALQEVAGVLKILDKEKVSLLVEELGYAISNITQGITEPSPKLLESIALSVGAVEASMTVLGTDRPDVEALSTSALEDLRHAVSQAGSQENLRAKRSWITDVGDILGQWLEKPADTEIRSKLLRALESAEDQAFNHEIRQLMEAIQRSDAQSGVLDPGLVSSVQSVYQAITRRSVSHEESAEDEALPAPEQSTEAMPALIDPEVEEMFDKETRVNLVALFEAGQAEKNTPVSYSLRRALHALAGSSAALGISSMAETSRALEGLLDKLDSASRDLNAGHREMLEEYAESVTDLLKSLREKLPWDPVNVRFRKLHDRIMKLVASETQGRETGSHGMRESIDLTDVYHDELRQLLKDFRAAVEAWFSAREGQEPLSDMVRIMHTIKGGARVTDLDSIAELAYASERLLQRLEHQNIGASEGLRYLFRQIEQALQEEAENIGKGLVQDDVSDLVLQLDNSYVANSLAVSPSTDKATETAGQTQEDNSSESEDDDEISAIFLDEAADILRDMDGVLIRLQQGGDGDAMKDLKRQFHTLKGGARMVGLTELGDLSHGVESMLQTNLDQGGSLDDRRLSLLREIRTEMIIAMESVRDGRAPSLQTVALKVEQLTNAARAGKTAVPATAKASAKAGKRKQKTARSRARKKSRSALPAVKTERATEARTLTENHADVPARSSAIRVDINTLDSLVNLTNEIGVSRSRLRLQYSGFVGMLEEMQSVAERFQTYFRDFEIEAETAMTSSPMLEAQASSAEFDPLELDRFSRLQQLTRSLSECVDDLSNIESGMERLVWQSETLFHHDARIYGKLHEGLLKTRMQPVGVLAGRLQHLVRVISKETGKQAKLEITGEDVELDRNILERMVAPLEHMVRNALVHGIEKPKKRRKLGKPEKGTIRIEFTQVYNEVIMQFSDDGAGINMEKLRERAVATGLANESIENHELAQLVLESGVSTSDQVTQLSGRGVGMEIVASEIRYLGGHIDVETRAGKGVTYIINIPLSLSITRANLVRVAGQVLAIPLSSVVQVQTLSENEFSRIKATKKPSISYRNKEYHYSSLAARLGLAIPEFVDGEQHVLLIRSGRRCIALGVDEVLDVEECVIKPLNPQISGVRSITGATVLGSGEVALLLDPGNLRREYKVEGASWKPGRRAGESAPPKGRLLVVDDSVTVRKVTERLLKRHGFQVDLARDGNDALRALDERKPDLILIDIEMPKMDGYELMEKIREKPGMADIPTIVVTSRSGGKHRKKALELGAADYFSKPYDDAALIESIQSILKKESPDD